MQAIMQEQQHEARMQEQQHEARMQEQQHEAGRTSATDLHDGVLYIRSASLVRHVIGKGGATIATLAENAGLDKKPFFSPAECGGYGGFDVYRLPAAKAIELQKEVERFLREFLGETPPTPNPITQAMAEPASVSFYSALLGDEEESEEEAEADAEAEAEAEAEATRGGRARTASAARGVRLNVSFRQKGGIESRKYHAKCHAKRRLERSGYEEQTGEGGGRAEAAAAEADPHSTITLDEYERGQAAATAAAAAQKTKRAPAAPAGTPMRRAAADQYYVF
jgi:hypothetical protein